jgi:hypothetical protein
VNHIARSLIVLLALFAASVCGISLETSLFDDSGDTTPIEATAAINVVNGTSHSARIVGPPRPLGPPPERSNIDQSNSIVLRVGLDSTDMGGLDIPYRPGVPDAPSSQNDSENVVGDTPQFVADLDIPFRTIGSNDAPPDWNNVLMAPKVQLFNGQGQFLSEQCVCQCKTRGARRLLRHRLR